MSIRRMSTSTLRERRNYPSMSTDVSLAWADVESATVSPATYTDGDAVWKYWKFTATGTMTIGRAGYLDMLVVGGGGNGTQTTQDGFASTGAGGGAAVRWGARFVTAGTHTATVGGGAATGLNVELTGGFSSFGSFLKSGGGRAPRVSDEDPIDRYVAVGGGGSQGGIISIQATLNDMPGSGQGGFVWGVNLWDGINLNYDGTTREYGKGGRINVDSIASTGSGGREGLYPGADGVIVVRVRIQ